MEQRQKTEEKALLTKVIEKKIKRKGLGKVEPKQIKLIERKRKEPRTKVSFD